MINIHDEVVELPKLQNLLKTMRQKLMKKNITTEKLKGTV
jgi:hypothetical protein